MAPPLCSSTTLVLNTRCASFPHHGNSRCRSLAELMPALVDHVAIFGVKFSALDPRRTPARQRSQRTHRQSCCSAVERRDRRPRTSVCPAQRQVTPSSVRKFGPQTLLTPPTNDRYLLPVPRVHRQCDPNRQTRRARRPIRTLFVSRVGCGQARSACARYPGRSEGVLDLVPVDGLARASAAGRAAGRAASRCGL